MGGMKVFIAESSPRIYDRLVKLVRAIDGVEVAGRNVQPSEAVGSMLMAAPDAVILDGGFGGGKGMETLRQIKKQNSQTVVFMIDRDAF